MHVVTVLVGSLVTAVLIMSVPRGCWMRCTMSALLPQPLVATTHSRSPRMAQSLLGGKHQLPARPGVEWECLYSDPYGPCLPRRIEALIMTTG